MSTSRIKKPSRASNLPKDYIYEEAADSNGKRHFKCLIVGCSSSHKSSNDLYRHHRTKHMGIKRTNPESKPHLACVLCKQTNNSPRSRSMHIGKAHRPRKERQQCKMCWGTWMDEAHLTREHPLNCPGKISGDRERLLTVDADFVWVKDLDRFVRKGTDVEKATRLVELLDSEEFDENQVKALAQDRTLLQPVASSSSTESSEAPVDRYSLPSSFQVALSARQSFNYRKSHALL